MRALVILYGVLIFVALGGCQRALHNNVQPSPARVGSAEKFTIADRQKWKPTDFFEANRELWVCEAISSGDIGKLTSLLKSGPELNAQGKFGITVLSWALFDEDMPAFELLLKHGADPDRRLNDEFEEAKMMQMLARGDSVLFTTLRHRRPQFCVAALPYSADVNQFDRSGEILLHTFFRDAPRSAEQLEALVKLGIDLDAKGYDGSTPCHLALSHPAHCLQLLKAGADPSVTNDDGRDVADSLERYLSDLAKTGQQAKHLKPIVAWLSEHYREIHKPPISADGVPVVDEDRRAE